MFGDLILWIKEHWKQFWCIHDYQWQGKLDFRYCACTKCGKCKDKPIIDKDFIMFIFIIIIAAALACLICDFAGII